MKDENDHHIKFSILYLINPLVSWYWSWILNLVHVNHRLQNRQVLVIVSVIIRKHHYYFHMSRFTVYPTALTSQGWTAGVTHKVLVSGGHVEDGGAQRHGLGHEHLVTVELEPRGLRVDPGHRDDQHGHSVARRVILLRGLPQHDMNI